MMNKRILQRFLLILGVTLVCVWRVVAYPGLLPSKERLKENVKLGLDLKGGIHMVMRVRTDDAVKAELDLSRERIRGALAEKGMVPSQVEPEGKDALVFSGIDAARLDEGRSLLRDQYPQYQIETAGPGRLRLTMRAVD